MLQGKEAFRELGIEYRSLIEGLLSEDRIVETRANVQRYFSVSGSYAAASFDLLKPNPLHGFVPADLAAAAFLNTPIAAPSYRALQERGDEIQGLLRQLSTRTRLWEMTEDEYAVANDLFEVLRSVKGLGPTRVSKLMARKRPKLIPILDERVRDFFRGRTEEFWWPLAIVLEDPSIRKRIKSLRPEGLPARISLLRVLDVAIWMRASRAPELALVEDEENPLA